MNQHAASDDQREEPDQPRRLTGAARPIACSRGRGELRPQRPLHRPAHDDAKDDAPENGCRYRREQTE